MTMVEEKLSLMSHRDLVDRRIDELMQLTSSIGMPIPRPKIVYNLSGVTGGMYLMDTNTIRINEALLVANLDHYLFQTVGHEFAHAVADITYPGCKAHGWEWRNVMYRLGLRPIISHNYDISKTRVRRNGSMPVSCGCTVPRRLSIIKYNKMVLKGQRYKCLYCNHIITKERK